MTKLQVGDLTAEKLPVIVLDHPVLKALGDVLGRPLDGIIGYTFFARYRTTIDYQAQRMTFEPVDFEVRDLIRELPDRLAGPKVARGACWRPAGLWGLTAGQADRGVDSPGVPVREVLADSPARRRRPESPATSSPPRRPLDHLDRRRLRRRRGRRARPGRAASSSSATARSRPLTVRPGGRASDRGRPAARWNRPAGRPVRRADRGRSRRSPGRCPTALRPLRRIPGTGS